MNRRAICSFVACFALVISGSQIFAAVELSPWSGAVTPDSAVVKVKMRSPGTTARLVLSRSADRSEPVHIQPDPSHATSNIAAFRLEDLTPDTAYYYAVEVDGSIAPISTGQFRTFPAGAASFTFAMGACAATRSNHAVFDSIAAQRPLFYLNTGDLHYRDIAVNDPDRFRRAFDEVLSSPRQSNLYRNVPLVYMWDDHDYGPNNSASDSSSRPAARQVYQEYVPHYPLANGSGQVPIDQAFTVGRARFIMSDLRSERDPNGLGSDATRRMISRRQLDWFKQQVLDASEAGQIIFWVSSVPWIAHSSTSADHWGGFAYQRREIANWLAGNRIGNFVILSGDAHMLAADDGSNANFSDDPDAPRIRVLQAAALDRGGSAKGGPYSHGTFPNPAGAGQYGLVTVTDLGETIEVAFSGRRVQGDGAEIEIVALSFTLTPRRDSR